MAKKLTLSEAQKRRIVDHVVEQVSDALEGNSNRPLDAERLWEHIDETLGAEVDLVLADVAYPMPDERAA